MDMWWWHQLTRPQGSFQKLLIAKYCPQSGSWHAKYRNSSNISGFWKWMLVFKYIALPSLIYKLGDGSNASFWHNRWCSQTLFKILFPKAFKLSVNMEAFVRDYWRRSRWRIHVNSPVTSRERRQLGEVWHILWEITPNIFEEDQVIWRWDKSENFLTKSTYLHFVDGGVIYWGKTYLVHKIST